MTCVQVIGSFTLADSLHCILYMALHCVPVLQSTHCDRTVNDISHMPWLFSRTEFPVWNPEGESTVENPSRKQVSCSRFRVDTYEKTRALCRHRKSKSTLLASQANGLFISFRKMLLQAWFITHSSQSEELFLHVAGTVPVLAPEHSLLTWVV